jgi:hypothetical protein
MPPVTVTPPVFQKIQVKVVTPELTIGDRLHADVFHFLDCFGNGFILNCSQCFRRNIAVLPFERFSFTSDVLSKLPT